MRAFCFVRLGDAQQPSPIASPTKHVPIALPARALQGWDPETYANFRRRCQEVADKSEADAPMDSSDYGYADACTKEGAYFHPVKYRPAPSVATTVVATPGPDGHIPLDIPLKPPSGSPYEKIPEFYARQRAICQEIVDQQFLHQAVDRESLMDCGRMRMTLRAHSKGDGHVPLDIPVSPPPGSLDPRVWANMRKECQIVADKQAAHQPVDLEQVKDCGQMRMTVHAYSHPASPGPSTSPSNLPLPTPTQGIRD